MKANAIITMINKVQWSMEIRHFSGEKEGKMTMKKPNTTANTATKAKRYDGEGTIRVREDGRWEYRISLGLVEGKYKYKSFYAKSEKELKKLIKQYQENRKKYVMEADKTPLSVYAWKWIKLYKFPNLRGNSRDRLESTYVNHIDPKLGSIPVNQISSDDVQMLINEKAQELSLSYIKKIYQFLNALFNHLECNQIVAMNPCKSVILPKEEHVAVKRKETEILSSKEIERLYQFSDQIRNSGNRFYKHLPAYIFILNTGLRCGEAIALEWSDIDFEKRECRVTKNFTLVKQRDKEENPGKRQKLVSETKTAAGRRTIPLNDKAVEALHQIQSYNEQMHIDTTHVISTETGERISERSLFRSLDYALGAIGAHHIGVHGLRHTFASRMLMAGIDITVVSKLLGHRDITTTYNTYIHIVEEQKQQVMQMIPSI